MKKLLFGALSLVLASCATYSFGDISERYCNETDPVIKKALKAQLISLGVVLPSDYCLTRKLITGK